MVANCVYASLKPLPFSHVLLDDVSGGMPVLIVRIVLFTVARRLLN